VGSGSTGMRTNTLASSCEMRANTSEFFFSKASCDANAFNYGRNTKK
jgi:hypothetical protein